MTPTTLAIGTTVALSAAGQRSWSGLAPAGWTPAQRQEWRGVVVGVILGGAHAPGWVGYTVKSGTSETYLNDYELTTTPQEQA